MTLIACDDVRLEHGRGSAVVRALDGVSGGIAERDRLAIVGRSGSGKSSLLHVLAAVAEPTGGAVEWRLDGEASPATSRALDDSGRRRIRRRVGIVLQGSNLLAHLDAQENVELAALAAGRRADDAADLLGLVGLAGKRRHLPQELSAGEQQRVALARAVAQQPRVLLCDEPTGHLDSDTGRRVLDLLDALQEELGFAVVVATHDVDVAARFERSLVLVDGRVAGSVA